MTNRDVSVPVRFRSREVEFVNGARGRDLDVPSASPLNYHQAIARPESMPAVTVDGKLFLPPRGTGKAPHPAIIVAPGSLGVADSHLRHAEAFTDAGIAAFVLDSFGARDVTSTVANQTQFSFAASAHDVLTSSRATPASCAGHNELEPERRLVGPDRGAGWRETRALVTNALRPCDRAVRSARVMSPERLVDLLSRSGRLAVVAIAGLALCATACTTEAREDPLSRSLRRRVERLEKAARAAPTDASNYLDRVSTLWDWGNALALAGEKLPVNWPRDVANARTADATGKAPDDTLLRTIDLRIRELERTEREPDALGELRFASSEPLESGSWVTLEQTWTVGSRPLQPGGKIVIAKQLATDQGRFQHEDPKADHYVSIRSSDPGARFEPTKVVLLGMHGAFRGNAPTLAFELQGAHARPR